MIDRARQELIREYSEQGNMSEKDVLRLINKSSSFCRLSMFVVKNDAQDMVDCGWAKWKYFTDL